MRRKEMRTVVRTIKLLLVGVLMASAVLAGEPESLRVKGERVNLRGRPDASGEVVGQVTVGEELRVRKMGDTWVEVVPPERVRCWVHKDFIQDGKVAVKELTVRAGASINYPRIGSLFRDDPVTPRETFGEWLCIPPPTNSSVWVHRDLLEVPGDAVASPADAVAATPVREAEGTPAAPAVVAPPMPMPSDVAGTTNTPTLVIPSPPAPRVFLSTGTSAVTTIIAHIEDAPPTNAAASGQIAPPTDLNLVPLPGQGVIVLREGFVKPAPYVLAPGRYRLASKKGNQLETVCFLRGNSQQLSGLIDEYLAMQGREYWVQGVREPVLVIERIERRPAPAVRP